MTAATQAEQQAIDLYQLHQPAQPHARRRGRQQIVEMMWQIAHADGRVTEFEDNLIWRAADLLHVPSRGADRAAPARGARKPHDGLAR